MELVVKDEPKSPPPPPPPPPALPKRPPLFIKLDDDAPPPPFAEAAKPLPNKLVDAAPGVAEKVEVGVGVGVAVLAPPLPNKLELVVPAIDVVAVVDEVDVGAVGKKVDPVVLLNEAVAAVVVVAATC